MVKIISDSSTLYSVSDANKAGFDSSPLLVSINGNSYKEYEDINSAEFIELIQQGNMPTSSQPNIGDVIAAYEKYPDDKILNITMADGLSGTYNTAVAAAQLCDNADNITVINSKTLCGPHRFLVENAVEMAKNGEPVEKIIERTHKLMGTIKSYLVPSDFGFLRRGGRLSPMVSYVGQIAKFAPIITQNEEGTQLISLGVKRSIDHALTHISNILSEKCNEHRWKVYITHAKAIEKAQKAKTLIQEKLPNAFIEIMELSPAFITQAGPGCVAIQVINPNVV